MPAYNKLPPKSVILLMNRNLRKFQQKVKIQTCHTSHWTHPNGTFYLCTLDDIAIAQAIHDAEKELKKEQPSIFNTTTVMMMVVAGGIIASRLAEEYFKRA